MISIEPLTSADRQDWSTLWQAYLRFYESELDPEFTDLTFARLVAGDGMSGALARDENDRAIGFVHWLPQLSTWSRAGYCYLEDLFVAPHVRGGGVGRALITHVRVWAVERGLDQVYWLTQESNSTARTLYDKVAERTGFLHYQLTLD